VETILKSEMNATKLIVRSWNLVLPAPEPITTNAPATLSTPLIPP
jgi:hypothetical protein